jgi:ABC-type phosphate transport system substrate-binding protein
MRTAKLATLLLGLLLAPLALADDGFKVVASPDVGAESLSKTELSDIFLKRSTTWPGGVQIQPVDQAEGVPAAEAFSKTVHHKPASVIRAFWKRVVATGREMAPPVKSRDDDVLAFVRANRGAIGYVSAGAATAGVKDIAVVGE